jgi:hypothetical protein
MNTRPQIFLAAALISCVFLGSAKSQVIPQSNPNAPNPTVPGPHPVTTAEYNLGDSAAKVGDFPGPVELRGSVTYPADLAGSLHPLVVFLHGRHATCFQGTTAFGGWPCAAGQQPIPNHHGYDYIAHNLASYGYVVVSISANGITAADLIADGGAQARALLIQDHLNLWNTFNTIGGPPFGSLFVGAIDMQNIGTMGHSRGGEGVIRHFQLNQSIGSPFGVKAVFAIAPIDFNGETINEAPFAVTLPYCDGDVGTLEGVHYYDDSRYNVPGDPAGKHALLVMGANHNFYNTVWTPGLFPAAASDDSKLTADPVCRPGGLESERLTPDQQQADGLVSVTSFFRSYLGHETQFLPLLATGTFSKQIDPATVHASYHPPDQPLFRSDLNRFLDPTSLTTSAVGGAIAETGLTPYGLCGGGGAEPTPCLPDFPPVSQPHYDGIQRHGALSQLQAGWNDRSATYTYFLPPGSRNVAGFQALQFRAGVNFTDIRNFQQPPPPPHPFRVADPDAQDFTITMMDGAGSLASVKVSQVAPGSLFFPPGSTPKSVLNTVRIPLKAFEKLDMSDIRQIDFKFDRTPTGAIMVTDIAFASIPLNP